MHPNSFYWKAENVLKPINKLRMVVDLQRKTAVYLSLANRQTTTSERWKWNIGQSEMTVMQSTINNAFFCFAITFLNKILITHSKCDTWKCCPSWSTSCFLIILAKILQKSTSIQNRMLKCTYIHFNIHKQHNNQFTAWLLFMNYELI